jgi:hypothetical protein
MIKQLTIAKTNNQVSLVTQIIPGDKTKKTGDFTEGYFNLLISSNSCLKLFQGVLSPVLGSFAF